MPEVRFEWDERKNAQNQRKHGVSFEEAQTAFLDDHAMLIDDPDHSSREERFHLARLDCGAASRGRVSLLPGVGKRHPHHLSTEGDGDGA